MIVSFKDASFSYGSELIFNNINFKINKNEKIALIGRNGCGKSTILKIINGQLSLDSGLIFLQQNLSIGYLAQTHFEDLNNTVLDEMLLSFQELRNLEEELVNLNDKLNTDPSEDNVHAYARKLDEFQLLGGYDYNNEIKSVLYGFGFTEKDLKKQLSAFSGGEQTKIYFAKLLLKKPDLLILDEPSNHLDLKTIKWLEGYLVKYPKAIIIVSHDRTMLNKLVTTIYELENHTLTKYVGNFDSYLIQKKENYHKNLSLYKSQQKEIKRLEAQIEKFRFKSSKAAFAQSKIKYLQRMDIIEKPLEINESSFEISFKSKIKGGKQVLSLSGLEFGYDSSLGCIDLNILRGNRICVMGDNGSGKSTLLKTLAGIIKPLSGYQLLGHQIEIGFFDQQLLELNSNHTLIDELYEVDPTLDLLSIRKVLASFLFKGDDVFKSVKILSGGEKVRLALAKLLLKKPNFLILDEPTNHLDIYAKEALEKTLKNYDGTILFVSHDRYFIKEIATSIVLLKDHKIYHHPQEYDEYLEKVTIEKEEAPIQNEKTVSKKPKKQYNLKKIETTISELEELLEYKRSLRYEEEYYQDSQKMNLLDQEIDDIHNQIANNINLWECAMLEEEKYKK